jgi:hypothetical protein
LRNPNVPHSSWLPYAGITRIRFEGFSREFSVLAHTPSRFELYHRLARAVKTVRDACGLIAKSGTATVCARRARGG